jgi:integrase/recombinase XerD
MATLKLTIDKRFLNKDKRYPIVIRITSEGKSATIPTKVNVTETEWDNESRRVLNTHTNHKKLNLVLQKKLVELETKLLELRLSGISADVVQLKAELIGKPKSNGHNLKTFAEAEIKLLKEQGRFGNAQAYQSAINKFLEYTGNSIRFEEVTYNLLTDFETALLKSGLKKNSIAMYMRELRAIYNKAILKGLVAESKYPFKNFRIKLDKTPSRAVTKADLEKIRQLDLIPNSPAWHARNVFFLIFNLIGISLVDLVFLERKNVINDRIIYTRRKTGKLYSIKLTKEAKALLKIYSTDTCYYLSNIIGEAEIPKSKQNYHVNLLTKRLNNALKKMGETAKIPVPITTYVARYSWANIAKSLGYSKDLIAEALGHEYGNRVTGIYLDNYGNEVIDEVNNNVTNFNR